MSFEKKPVRKVGVLIAACLALGAISAPIQAWADPSEPVLLASASANLNEEATKKAADVIAANNNPTTASAAAQPLIALAGTPYHADKVAAWASVVESTYSTWTNSGTPANLNAGAAGYTLSALFAAGRPFWGDPAITLLDAMVIRTNTTTGQVATDAFNQGLALTGVARGVKAGYGISTTSGFASTQAWVDSMTKALLNLQQAGGNWAFWGSEPDTTGIALQALAGAKDIVSPEVAALIDAAVAKATAWADSTAISDETTGGEYWKSSNSAGVYNSTGLLIGGLVLWGYDVSSAVDFMVGRQLADGNWAATLTGTNGNNMATVQGIQGVSGFGYLNAKVGQVATPSSPVITAQPVSVALQEGETANFSVTATSSSAISYQWQQLSAGATEWTDIAGATASFLSVENVTSDHQGHSYRVVVTNFVGSTTSGEAGIQVIQWHEGPCINDEGVTVVLDYNDWASESPTGEQYVVRCAILSDGATGVDALRGAGFDVEVSGDGYLDTINGIPGSYNLFWGYSFAEPGDDEWTLSEDGVTERHPLPGGVEGFRLMDWSIEWDTVPGVGPVFGFPVILTQPKDLTVNEGDNASFSVEAQAPEGREAGLSYQWQELVDEDWTDIPEATNAQFSLSSVATSDNGRIFRVVVSAGQAQVTSEQAKLTVNAEAPVVPGKPAPEVPTTGSEGSLFGLALMLAVVTGAGGLVLRSARAKQ